MLRLSGSTDFTLDIDTAGVLTRAAAGGVVVGDGGSGGVADVGDGRVPGRMVAAGVWLVVLDARAGRVVQGVGGCVGVYRWEQQLQVGIYWYDQYGQYHVLNGAGSSDAGR